MRRLRFLFCGCGQAMDELWGNPRNVSLFYTRDYNMSPGRPALSAPVQGGFLCVKPNRWAFETLWAIVRKGDYGKGQGWGGSRIGNFWGGMTIQGLVPYFVVKVAPPAFSEEVDRCVYNQMVRRWTAAPTTKWYKKWYKAPGGEERLKGAACRRGGRERGVWCRCRAVSAAPLTVSLDGVPRTGGRSRGPDESVAGAGQDAGAQLPAHGTRGHENRALHAVPEAVGVPAGPPAGALHGLSPRLDGRAPEPRGAPCQSVPGPGSPAPRGLRQGEERRGSLRPHASPETRSEVMRWPRRKFPAFSKGNCELKAYL